MSLPEFDPEVEPPADPDPVACVNCGSPSIRRRSPWVLFGAAAIVAIAVGLATDLTEMTFFAVGAAAIFAVIADRWVCDECGTTWK